MIWQDTVITVGNAIFAFSLLPSIRSKEKPHLYTSMPTAIVLYIFAATFLTLDLIYASVVTLISALLWTLLVVQKYKYRQ
jgi:hypothetical protein